MMDKTSLTPLIPVGDYCYSHTGRMVVTDQRVDSTGVLVQSNYYYILPETKSCPFWKGLPNARAFCSFLETTSEHDDDTNLMWDQIKICGKNTKHPVNSATDEPENRAVLDLDKSNCRQNKTPEFIDSLVRILSSSVDNNFKYDGITYTLHESIVRNLNCNF